MEITYFEVYLKDGTTFDFDYKCNTRNGKNICSVKSKNAV